MLSINNFELWWNNEENAFTFYSDLKKKALSINNEIKKKYFWDKISKTFKVLWKKNEIPFLKWWFIENRLILHGS